MKRMMNKYILGLVLTLGSGASQAAIYMLVEGIKGTVTAKGHENWIAVDGASMSSSNINYKVVMSPVVVTKMLDSSSPLLNLEVWAGKPKRVTIHLVTGSIDQNLTYMEYILENARFISVETSTGGDRPTETYKIDYDQIKGQYTPLDNTGKPSAPLSFGFDLTTGTKL